ncbi:hypothetical protein BS47DRAFT_1378123 [Hydnum rufescens UP504]|uniref:RRM domain-containing protein n=1 Tax=Hydnum rufescens UP504 TaxID=1448309 RepID=A0A9P6DPL3_9AGAM|nr:hypothetical protein BS47DRAFT_1378123 [Hydnum rufescens UP504]
MSDTQVVAASSKKLKPARKQVKPGQVEKKESAQSGKEYNIWYNKWAGGDREDSYSNKEKSQTRCNINRDTGFTRADAAGVKYCCLFFARGCCPYGSPDSSKDCFAREKFSDYRDDMGGVGSFNRQNRTLYIGRIRETGNANETEEVIRRHFREWGAIERVKILQHRSVAFVTYVNELDGQFAKEAMACQSLDNDEILNVRWATEDPNPTQKEAEQRRLEDIGTAAIAAKLDPRMVDAVRSIRALEDGEDIPLPYVDESQKDATQDEESDQEEGQPRKRRRIEHGDSSEIEEEEQAPSGPTGLLSAETWEGLRYFAQMKQAQGVNVKLTTVSNRPAPPPARGIGGLGDYGSDEDSD